MDESLKDYFDALDRIVSGKPNKVQTGTRITKDAVSLEAGRGRGSIKKSRPIFARLLDAIESASKSQIAPDTSLNAKLKDAKAEAKKYRSLWEAALAREISLMKQLWDERAEWAAEKSALTGDKVVVLMERKLRKIHDS